MPDGVIVVGLGGTGTRIVDAFLNKLPRDPSIERHLGQRLQVCCFDTTACVVDAPRAARYFERVRPFNLPRAIKNARENDTDGSFRSWFFDEYNPTGDTGSGAGAIRIKGRMAFAYNAGTIETRIRTAETSIRTLVKPRADEEQRNSILAIICGILSNGTASGMAVDFAYLLRRTLGDLWDSRVEGCWVDASVALSDKQAGTEEYDRCLANGWAALYEMQFWSVPSEREGLEPEDRAYRFQFGALPPVSFDATDRAYDHGWLFQSINRAGHSLGYNQIVDLAGDFLMAMATPELGGMRARLADATWRLDQGWGSFGKLRVFFPTAAVASQCVLKAKRTVLAKLIEGEYEDLGEVADGRLDAWRLKEEGRRNDLFDDLTARVFQASQRFSKAIEAFGRSTKTTWEKQLSSVRETMVEENVAAECDDLLAEKETAFCNDLDTFLRDNFFADPPTSFPGSGTIGGAAAFLSSLAEQLDAHRAFVAANDASDENLAAARASLASAARRIAGGATTGPGRAAPSLTDELRAAYGGMFGPKDKDVARAKRDLQDTLKQQCVALERAVAPPRVVGLYDRLRTHVEGRARALACLTAGPLKGQLESCRSRIQQYLPTQIGNAPSTTSPLELPVGVAREFIREALMPLAFVSDSIGTYGATLRAAIFDEYRRVLELVVAGQVPSGKDVRPGSVSAGEDALRTAMQAGLERALPTIEDALIAEARYVVERYLATGGEDATQTQRTGALSSIQEYFGAAWVALEPSVRAAFSSAGEPEVGVDQRRAVLEEAVAARIESLLAGVDPFWKIDEIRRPRGATTEKSTLRYRTLSQSLERALDTPGRNLSGEPQFPPHELELLKTNAGVSLDDLPLLVVQRRNCDAMVQAWRDRPGSDNPVHSDRRFHGTFRFVSERRPGVRESRTLLWAQALECLEADYADAAPLGARFVVTAVGAKGVNRRGDQLGSTRLEALQALKDSPARLRDLEARWQEVLRELETSVPNAHLRVFTRLQELRDQLERAGELELAVRDRETQQREAEVARKLVDEYAARNKEQLARQGRATKK